MLDVPQFLRTLRDGKQPQQDDLKSFIQGVVTGDIPKYQASAFLMAVFCRGLDKVSTTTLTEFMRDSGTVIKHPGTGPFVDKHSTGGVGDKISIPLAPIVAACGVPVPMMAGRGLGHTGGTLDKLESIEGFQVVQTPNAFVDAVQKNGLAIIGQSEEMVPADRIFYALRDVTATVESIPLITASILSKKLAEGIDGLVMDIKVGRAAFMKTLPEAKALAQSILNVGTQAGIPVTALLTAMDHPLGRTIGNALEIKESVEILKGQGPKVTTELTYRLAIEMLKLGGQSADDDALRSQIETVISKGQALHHFERMVIQQGGNPAFIEDLDLLPQAARQWELLSPISGYIRDIDAMTLGRGAMKMGSGRQQASDTIHHGVGIEFHVEVGDAVQAGQPLCKIHDDPKLVDAKAFTEELTQAFQISEEPPSAPTLVYETLTSRP